MPKGKTIIHSTLDPAHLNKDVEAKIGLVGDAVDRAGQQREQAEARGALGRIAVVDGDVGEKFVNRRAQAGQSGHGGGKVLGFDSGLRGRRCRIQRLKAQPVGGVRSVGDQLTEKNLAIAVERMHHEVQKLLHLGLKTVGFTRLDCHGNTCV